MSPALHLLAFLCGYCATGWLTAFAIARRYPQKFDAESAAIVLVGWPLVWLGLLWMALSWSVMATARAALPKPPDPILEAARKEVEEIAA